MNRTWKRTGIWYMNRRCIRVLTLRYEMTDHDSQLAGAPTSVDNRNCRALLMISIGHLRLHTYNTESWKKRFRDWKFSKNTAERTSLGALFLFCIRAPSFFAIFYCNFIQNQPASLLLLPLFHFINVFSSFWGDAGWNLWKYQSTLLGA